MKNKKIYEVFMSFYDNQLVELPAQSWYLSALTGQTVQVLIQHEIAQNYLSIVYIYVLGIVCMNVYVL